MPNLKAVLPEIVLLPVSSVNQRTFQSTKNLDEIKPIAANRVKIEFRADEPVAEMLERAKQLLRHKYPHGRLEDIFREVLELFLEKKDPSRKPISKGNGRAEVASSFLKEKSAQHESIDKHAKNPLRSVTRYIPQEIRREIWQRDQGKCVYQSSDGKRCGEEAFIEIDHVQPFALGGSSTLENLRLLCRTHNQWRAKQTFGSSAHSENGGNFNCNIITTVKPRSLSRTPLFSP